MVDQSPWPLVTSLVTMVTLASTCFCLWGAGTVGLFCLSLFLLVLSAWQWWRDVIRESTLQGHHTSKVVSGIYIGVLLFILSEVIFFFSFFFGYFFVGLSPDIGLGCNWPPLGIEALSWSSAPLLNTMLLLSSGVSITWCHHSLMEGQLKESISALVVTVLLGAVFLSVQADEYFSVAFCLSDSSYGSFFFLITGFHGLHVFIGLVFIIISGARILLLHFSCTHILGIEAAIWYWHFVDVVWLFLFISVYWWGS